MSAPILFVVVPLIIMALLMALRLSELAVQWIAAGVCLLLALMAIVLPIGSSLAFGQMVFDFPSTFSFLGRQLILGAEDKTLLALLYGLGAFWFVGARTAQVPKLFYPSGLGIIALLIAALAVEPFLYSALLIEMAVLLSIPMLIGPDRKVGSGLLRYLIFQTLAMPFILLAGWVLGSVEVSPSREMLLQQAALLLGLGFAFWLAVFPFYSWVPLLSSEINPYLSGFMLSVLPAAVLLLSLDFLNGFVWLRGNPLMYQVLTISGLVMVVAGGFWSAFQDDLRRMFGYAVIVENGFALLALGSQSGIGLELFAASFLPRFLTMGIWALALTAMRQQQPDLNLRNLGGGIHRMPFAGVALILAIFSFGGLPLLADFPLRQTLFGLIGQQNNLLVLWAFLGGAAFLFNGFRIAYTLVLGERVAWPAQENGMQKVLLVSGSAALLLVGLFPTELMSRLVQLLLAFPNLYTP